MSVAFFLKLSVAAWLSRISKRRGAESADEVLLEELCVLGGSAFQTPARLGSCITVIEQIKDARYRLWYFLVAFLACLIAGDGESNFHFTAKFLKLFLVVVGQDDDGLEFVVIFVSRPDVFQMR